MAGLGLAVLLSACTGGVALEDLPQQYAAAFCDPIGECTEGAGGRGLFFGLECEAFFAGTVRNTTVPGWTTVLERGTVGYDEGMAAACLDGVRGLGCDAFIGAPPPECDEIFTGTVEEGGPCSLSEECAGDAWCEGADCPGSPGTCTARKGSGAECGGDEECTTGLVCEGGTCGSPESRSGGACGAGSDLTCPLDEICVGADAETMTPGTCTPRSEVQTGALGEPCDALDRSALCQPDLRCALTGGGMAGLQFECVEPVSAGAPCHIASPSMCPEDQYCDAEPLMGVFEGTCVPLPTEGMACATSLDGSCAAGLRCARDGEGDGTCVRVKDNGAACALDDECFSGRCVSGTCAAPELCAG
jgi:hypothetical protein